MEVNIRGQIVHIRKVSKKMMFVDIFVTEEGVGDCRRSLLFKFWETPDLRDRSSKGPEKLHVGDIIACTGLSDNETFIVRNYNFIEKWSEMFPGETFLPKPPETSVSAEKKGLQCKFFLNSGKCNVVNCTYEHKVLDLKKSRQQFVEEKKERRLLVHEAQFDVEEIQSSSKRAELFSDWILETYGKDHLCNGVVLDIAGGRGDLAFELGMKNNLNCEVVDPRPRKLKRWQTSWLKKRGNPALPRHHKQYFQEDFFSDSDLTAAEVRLVTGNCLTDFFCDN